MASTYWGNVPATEAPAPRSGIATIMGQPPQTLNLPVYEAPQEAFITANRHTPEGQRLLGDSQRGGRILGSISTLLSIGGIMAEIACILAAVSGAQQASKIDWPLASAPATWRQCGYLPNSDAPATRYGAAVAVLYHTLNVIVFAGMLSFLVRFAKRPKADYGIGCAGLFHFWLGTGLAARWLGTLQVVIGLLLAVTGIFNFAFGFYYFRKAAVKAFVPAAIIRRRAEEQQKLIEQQQREEDERAEKERDPNVWTGTVDEAIKQLQAYRAEGLDNAATKI